MKRKMKIKIKIKIKIEIRKCLVHCPFNPHFPLNVRLCMVTIMSHTHNHSHFKDKDAIGHVAEVQAEGILAAAEVHGTELPGHLSAAADAARETALLMVFVWALLLHLHLPTPLITQLLAIFAFAWSVWKCGRSAWLGWARLERLHRVLEQEKWEIEHHRQQERDELRVLYATKGFEGKLLEDVLDVLMADDNRLLAVMVQEELGLSLESHEHPLKQSLGAFFGGVAAALLCLLCLQIHFGLGLPFGAAIAIAISAAFSAHYAGNRLIPSIVWNLGLSGLSFGCLYFLLEYLFSFGSRL